MLISLPLRLQVERKVKHPKCIVASLGMTVHAEFGLRGNCFLQTDLKATFINVKSIIFRPPFLLSPIIDFSLLFWQIYCPR